MSASPSRPLGAFGAFLRAWRATLASSALAAVGIALYTVLSLPTHFLGQQFDATPSALNQQEALVKLIVAQFVGLLALDAVVGPFFSALAVYAAWRHVNQQDAPVYGGINFALSRYTRLFGWYLVVQLCVQIGLQIVVLPGILFFLMYAFVVPVRCLEQVRFPLERSKKLTASRRRSIFLLFLPLVVISIVLGFLDLFGTVRDAVGQALGTAQPSDAAMAVAWAGIEAVRLFYAWLMTAALTFLYLDRTGQLQPAPSAVPAGA